MVIENIYFGELVLTLLGKLIRLRENLSDKLKQMNKGILSLDELLERYPGISIKELNRLYANQLGSVLSSDTVRGASVRDFEGRHFVRKGQGLAAHIGNNIHDFRKERLQETFTPPKLQEHNFEYVAKKRGVDYINDSKATNVNSTRFSLERINAETVLILGGQEKNNNYEEIIDLVREKVTSIICIGKDNTLIKKAFKPIVKTLFETSSMKDAVHAATDLAYPDHTVLLSPASASFDLFHNFQDRGHQFKQEVLQLPDAA